MHLSKRITGCEVARLPACKVRPGTEKHVSSCRPTIVRPEPVHDDDDSVFGLVSEPPGASAAPAPARSDLSKVVLPPGEGLYFAAPPLESIDDGAVLHMHWNTSSVFGHVALLDPTNELLWATLRGDPRPKIIVFVPAEDRQRVLSLVLAVARTLTSRLKFGIADGCGSPLLALRRISLGWVEPPTHFCLCRAVEEWAPALNNFGVDRAVAREAAVAVATNADPKLKQVGGETGAELDGESLLRFAEAVAGEAAGGAPEPEKKKKPKKKKKKAKEAKGKQEL